MLTVSTGTACNAYQLLWYMTLCPQNSRKDQNSMPKLIHQIACISILSDPSLQSFAMMQQKDELAKLAKYKQFLIANGFPQNLPEYDVESYWDARYELEQQQVYDWYVQPGVVKQLFGEFVDHNAKILQLGSGKSAMLDLLYKWGYKDLIGSDFSWTLINQKKSEERYLKRGIRWERIDVTKEWPDFQADCIVEKATLDCLNPRDIRRAIDYINRMLRPGGVFFHISCCPPEQRINILKKWDVKVYEFPKTIIPVFAEIDDSKSYYAYVCTK